MQLRAKDESWDLRRAQIRVWLLVSDMANVEREWVKGRKEMRRRVRREAFMAMGKEVFSWWWRERETKMVDYCKDLIFGEF